MISALEIAIGVVLCLFVSTARATTLEGSAMVDGKPAALAVV